MNITTRTNHETTIMDLKGHIDLSTSPVVRKSMLDCLKQADRLAVNLVGVKYIDSSGIASLLEVLKEARKCGKTLVLFALTVGVREVLQLTRLTGVFQIYEGEEEALAGTPGQGSGRS